MFGAAAAGEMVWRSQLAAFLQLAFLMISAPSGKRWQAKGDRWNCFHNLFKYVVDFSSPFKPSQQLQHSLASKKKDMFDFISFHALFRFLQEESTRQTSVLGDSIFRHPSSAVWLAQKECGWCSGMFSRHIWCHHMDSCLIVCSVVSQTAFISWNEKISDSNMKRHSISSLTK